MHLHKAGISVHSHADKSVKNVRNIPLRYIQNVKTYVINRMLTMDNHANKYLNQLTALVFNLQMRSAASIWEPMKCKCQNHIIYWNKNKHYILSHSWCVYTYLDMNEADLGRALFQGRACTHQTILTTHWRPFREHQQTLGRTNETDWPRAQHEIFSEVTYWAPCDTNINDISTFGSRWKGANVSKG